MNLNATTTPLTDAVLIPAAGLGSRLWPQGCAKELFPLGFSPRPGSAGEVRPKAVSEYSLERARLAGVKHAFVVIGAHKPELVRYFGSGEEFGMHIAYLYQAAPTGLASAIDVATPWVAGARILLGLPDTVIFPVDAHRSIRRRLITGCLDLVLGVFPTDRPEWLGPVRLDKAGRILEVQDKPLHTDLCNTWGTACWGPAFTELLHVGLARARRNGLPEPPLGYFFQQAVVAGLKVEGESFPEGIFIDIGTAEGLTAARRMLEPTFGQVEKTACPEVQGAWPALDTVPMRAALYD
ncbi:sugar phosphate nucleotidyltransferase [Trichloromonas sp.]|uniref:sugar phosphate nucleotidyltransferase n=1 Tax=Trichloromonas sp. TaxID=3069249 RepID=UPI003D816606